MTLTEKIGFCKDLVVVGSLDSVRKMGHYLGYGAEIVGILSLINAHDDPKQFYMGAALYVAGRACNNLRQQLIVNEKLGDNSHLLSVKRINDLLEINKKE
ncbi:MAG: hypothetical protein Q8R47_03285 [Nanoarchaeota archaeon]|nr:hypothetical protein [Nanoarchaeota archaeon]